MADFNLHEPEDQPTAFERLDTWLARNYPVLWAVRPHYLAMVVLVGSAVIIALTLAYVSLMGRPKPDHLLLMLMLTELYLPLFIFVGGRLRFEFLKRRSAFFLEGDLITARLKLQKPKWGQFIIGLASRAVFLCLLLFIPIAAEAIAQGESGLISPTSKFSIPLARLAPSTAICLSMLSMTTNSIYGYLLQWYFTSFLVGGGVVLVYEQITNVSAHIGRPLTIFWGYLMWLLIFQIFTFRPSKPLNLLAVSGLGSLPIVLSIVEYGLHGAVGMVTWSSIGVLGASLSVLRNKITIWEARP